MQHLKSYLSSFVAVTTLCLLTTCLYGGPNKKKVAEVREQLRRRAVALAVKKGEKAELPRNNDGCLTKCHENLSREKIVREHQGKGVLCIHCHGLSAAHLVDDMIRSDSDFPLQRKQIDGFCSQCHTRGCEEPNRKAAVLARAKTTPPRGGKQLRQDATCLECHGNHSLSAVASTHGHDEDEGEHEDEDEHEHEHEHDD